MPKLTLNHTLRWVLKVFIRQNGRNFFAYALSKKKTFKKHTRKIYTFFYVPQNCHITPFHTNNNF